MTTNDNTPGLGYAGHVGDRLSRDYFMTVGELRIVRKACEHMGLSFHQVAARKTLRRTLIPAARPSEERNDDRHARALTTETPTPQAIGPGLSVNIC